MKKILLRKDYKTMVVPVESAVGLYLAQSIGMKNSLTKTLKRRLILNVLK